MRCVVLSCGADLNGTADGFSAHRFPKKAAHRLAWLRALDPSGSQYQIIQGARVCSRHFRADEIYEAGGKRQLVKGAVPSRRLGPAAKLPPVDISDTEESHYVFLDESMMVSPDQQAGPATLYSTAVEAMYEARASTGEPRRFKTIRYAGDLKDDDIPYISPEEAQEILPKIYKQLHRTKMRLNCYKQQNLRLRKKVEYMKDIIMDLRDEHDGVKPKSSSQQVTEMKSEPTVQFEVVLE